MKQINQFCFCSYLLLHSPRKDDFSVSIYLRHLLIIFLSKNIQFRMRKGHDQSQVPVQDKMFLKNISLAVHFILHQDKVVLVIVVVMLLNVSLMSCRHLQVTTSNTTTPKISGTSPSDNQHVTVIWIL